MAEFLSHLEGTIAMLCAATKAHSFFVYVLQFDCWAMEFDCRLIKCQQESKSGRAVPRVSQNRCRSFRKEVRPRLLRAQRLGEQRQVLRLHSNGATA